MSDAMPGVEVLWVLVYVRDDSYLTMMYLGLGSQQREVLQDFAP